MRKSRTKEFRRSVTSWSSTSGRPSIEVVSACIAGYSIGDESGLFQDQAWHMEPDVNVTILQVLDNDISDMFYFQKTLYTRNGQRFRPTPEGLVLFVHIRQDMAAEISRAGGKR
jgi:hypothetical protein